MYWLKCVIKTKESLMSNCTSESIMDRFVEIFHYHSLEYRFKRLSLVWTIDIFWYTQSHERKLLSAPGDPHDRVSWNLFRLHSKAQFDFENSICIVEESNWIWTFKVITSLDLVRLQSYHYRTWKDFYQPQSNESW